MYPVRNNSEKSISNKFVPSIVMVQIHDFMMLPIKGTSKMSDKVVTISNGGPLDAG